MDHKKNLGAAIKQYRKAKGIGQDRLSEIIGIDQSGISRIERGKQVVTADQMALIARALDVHVSELWQAAEGMSENKMVREVGSHYQATPPNLRTVPLIGWVQAGSWTASPTPQAGDHDDYIATQTKVGKRAYALTVRGDSMTNPRGWPTFPDGIRILVDPDAEPSPGSFVIAQIDGEPEATFKKFVQDGGRTYLVPLNPQYPTLTIDQSTHICGVVVAIPENTVGFN